jgi:mannose-6-phosphate isomerase-like protein (cupin superfamily)
LTAVLTPVGADSCWSFSNFNGLAGSGGVSNLRRDGFRPVYASLRPNVKETNHCHDFDARLFVLGGEITITRDNVPETFRAGQCCEVPAGCMHTDPCSR